MNYKTLPAYGKIIYVTVVVYAVTQLWKLTTLLFCWSGFDWAQWLALPAYSADYWMRPWTLLTYMFCHANLSQDPFHIIFNMLWLWWFGQFFMRNHSARQLVWFYLTSGIVAGIFFLICYNAFPYFSLSRYYTTVVGASGAIFALITAVAISQPETQLGLNLFVKVIWVKMKWLAVIVLALNLLFAISANNSGGNVCHIGGILFGLLYGFEERRGNDITRWPMRLYESVADWLKALRRPKMTATRGGRQEPISAEKKRDMDYNAGRRSHEQQINAILDKISRSGYDGLTAEEKQMLFDASRSARSNKKEQK